MPQEPARGAAPDAAPVRILASPTPNPASLKFTVDRPLLEGRTAQFQDAAAAERSPLARRLFALEGVTGVFVAGSFVTVSRSDPEAWATEAHRVGQAIREFLRSGEKVLPPGAASASGPASEIEARIRAVLEEIRPYVQGDGGDIIFAGYDDGLVRLVLQGSCSGCPSSTATLRLGIESRLKEVVPEVVEVVAI